MNPNIFTRTISLDSHEDFQEHFIHRAEQLYDLDGETFLRNRDGRIETGGWSADEVMS